MDAGRVSHKVSSLLKEHLERYGLGVQRGPQRVMRELTTGMVWSGSVQLTNAVRLFAQTPRQLEKAVWRMSRHLADRQWDHRPLAQAVLADQANEIEDDTLIPIDGTELAKPYARRMEYQGTVRDASRPGDPHVPGYWCWGAYRFDASDDVLTPLWLQPYSTRQPGFRSENDVFIEACRRLRSATGGRGIWLSDRGGDRPSILSAWLRMQPRWIIRLRGDRGLIGPDGTRQPAQAWAEWALQHRPERGRAVTLPVRLPPDEIAQAPQASPLWLVAPTYTFADGQRWLLLTCGLIDQHVGPRQVRYDYALRWRAEDAKRFLGQVWHVEKFLTRSFVALERMLLCVVLAAGFVAMLQRDYPTLRQQLESEGLRWNVSYRLPIYRLATGLKLLAVQVGLLAALHA